MSTQKETDHAYESLPTFKDKTVLVGDMHLGGKGNDGVPAQARFDVLKETLTAAKNRGEPVKSIVDMGDFYDKAGGLNAGSSEQEVAGFANRVAQERLALAKAAGIDPRNYIAVTGNHDLPTRPVIKNGKFVPKENIEKFDADVAKKATEGLDGAESVRKKLETGETPTEAEITALLQKNPSLARKLVECDYSNADIALWKKAHRDAGIMLVTVRQTKEWIGKLPNEEMKTVLKHFVVNDGPNMRRVVAESDVPKLKESGGKQRAGDVGRQVGGDIHTLGIVQGENWQSGGPFQTILNPTLGAGTAGRNGFLLLGADQHVELLEFEPGTTTITHNKNIIIQKGAQKPETPPKNQNDMPTERKNAA